VRIFGSFETGGYVYYVLQHIPGQSLYELMETQTRVGLRCCESDVNRWMKQVLVAIKHCHARGVMHRDIKPENILIHSKTNDAYVVDFGLATTAKTSSDWVGTVDYMSPQMVMLVTGKDPKVQHTQACDIWSVGAVWYDALTGCSPFGDESSDFEPTYDRILKNRFTDPDALQVDKLLGELLTSMLQTSEAARPTALQACSHRWWQTLGMSE
jgi:serine/threonine protein kinase